MIVKYPPAAISEASRLSVCYKLQELLRLEHNEMSVKYRAGEITKAEYTSYLKDVFEPTFKTIDREANINRELTEKSTFWAVTLKTAVAKEVAEI